MANLRYFTSGESHGKGLVGILDGVPAGFVVSAGDIDADLKRRQGGYGRGGRMKIESDHAEILSGIRWGKTLGSPISLLIGNMDWKNWEEGMSADAAFEGSIKPVTRPRPGHADLAGALKYNQRDVRNILERSSARETAVRVGLGAIAKKLLSEFGIAFGSYVVRIGSQKIDVGNQNVEKQQLLELFSKAEKSPVRCPDADASKKMVRQIDQAVKNGNSLGGVYEIFVTGLPPGLGSHTQWDRKLDGRLAQAMMSIQAMKGVEIGRGFEMCGKPGSDVMDEIFYRSKAKGNSKGFFRKTNNSGGIEGGMTNGMPVIIRVGMKPIPTLRKPLMSVDLNTRKPFSAAYERSDVCAVPAAAVVGEAMAALVLADAFLEKFGGDSRDEILRNFDSYMSYIDSF
jgi:chorismate synthase